MLRGSRADVCDALSLLKPYDINVPKIRIGPNCDGGYILADILSPDQTVLSYGISTEYSFDRTMAERGHRVLMFDHTIDGIKDPHPNMTFIREGVAGAYRHDLDVGYEACSDQSLLLYSIKDHLKRYDVMSDRLILKMDVEGIEWAALAHLDDRTLRRFDQIVLEIHGLGDLDDNLYRKVFSAALENVNRHFTLFHVHANNVDGPDHYYYVAGMAVSCLMEISFVRTDLVKVSKSTTVYPTAIDFPNLHDRDRLLWMFPFLPDQVDSATLQESLAHAKRPALVAANAGRGLVWTRAVGAPVDAVS